MSVRNYLPAGFFAAGFFAAVLAAGFAAFAAAAFAGAGFFAAGVFLLLVSAMVFPPLVPLAGFPGPAGFWQGTAFIQCCQEKMLKKAYAVELAHEKALILPGRSGIGALVQSGRLSFAICRTDAKKGK